MVLITLSHPSPARNMAAAKTPTVRTLKPTNYEKELFVKILETEIQCSICLDTYIKPRGLICKHVFCQKCLVDWLRDHNTCPICRSRISHVAIKCDWLESIIKDIKEDFNPSPINLPSHRRSSLISKNGVPVNRRNVEKENFQRPPWR